MCMYIEYNYYLKRSVNVFKKCKQNLRFILKYIFLHKKIFCIVVEHFSIIPFGFKEI